MRQYIVKRVIVTIPTVLLTTLIVFLLMKLVPGDAATAIMAMAEDAPVAISADGAVQVEQEIRERLGLDAPLPIQYGRWLLSVGKGELGNSFVQGRTVTEIVTERMPRTAQLAVMIMILTVVWAVPCGIFAAIRPWSATDQWLRVLSVIGLSVPNIWLAVIFLFVFSRFIGWLPPLEWKGLFEAPTHNLMKLLAPSLIVAFSVGAPIVRMVRGEMLEVLREDYIRTAYAKGLKNDVVLIRHALRNASLPVVTQFGHLFAALITGIVVTETIFNIPGMGKAFVDAMGNRDYPVIQGLMLVNVGLVLSINLAIDIAYSVLDPRIRYS